MIATENRRAAQLYSDLCAVYVGGGLAAELLAFLTGRGVGAALSPPDADRSCIINLGPDPDLARVYLLIQEWIDLGTDQ